MFLFVIVLSMFLMFIIRFMMICEDGKVLGLGVIILEEMGILVVV